MRFLDNVLQDFIDNAQDDFERSTYSAMRERSVGLGVMGFHSFLQKMRIPMEGVMAKVWNKRMFRHIRTQADAASRKLADERGACPDAADYGIKERFSNKMAVAPTASVSIICGGASPGIEPNAANSFTHKTLSGSYNVRNKYLKELLAERDRDDAETWSSITTKPSAERRESASRSGLRLTPNVTRNSSRRSLHPGASSPLEMPSASVVRLLRSVAR